LKNKRSRTPQAGSKPDLYLRADKKLRNIALILTVIFSAVGISVIVYFRDAMAQARLIEDDNPVAALEILMGFMDHAFVLFLILTVPAVVSGVSMFRTSRLAYKTGRFPPPGTRVIKDTKLLLGKAAKRRGIAGMIVSTLLMAGMLLFTIFLFYVLRFLMPQLA